MKYIVVTSTEEGEQLFIFPLSVNHDAFAEVLSYIKYHKNGNTRDWNRIYRKPVSAGFTDGNTCYGRSESLNLSSRPTQDTALLAAQR